MTLALDTVEQAIQMEALLAEVESYKQKAEGLSLLWEFTVQETVGDYLAGRFNRPTQFDFENHWRSLGNELPIDPNTLFNWVNENGENRGLLSTINYDRFCIPIVQKYTFYDSSQETPRKMAYEIDDGVNHPYAIPLVFTARGWLTDTLLYGDSYMFLHEATYFRTKGSFALALDGAHQVILQQGRMFDVDISNDNFLLRQMGFVKRETLSDFSDLDNTAYNWWDTYQFINEGTYGLLGVAVLYGRFREWNGKIAGAYFLSAGVPVIQHPDGYYRVANAADDNGKFTLVNTNMGTGTPTRSIELRSDASVEIFFGDSYVPQTNGMPRIAFWGANGAALPANANTVPANGWALKWSSKYDTLAIFKDGVSQGSWAITPPSTVIPFTTWIEVIQSGTIYEIYFNGTLLGQVTSTYVFTHKAVGVFAYNRDVAAGTTAACTFWLYEIQMSTFSNLNGGVREVFSDGTDTEFYYLDKFGKYCIHEMPGGALTRVAVTNPSVDNILIAGDTHVAIVSLGGDYIEFRNKASGALVQTVNVSADPDHLGFVVYYSPTELGFRLYNRGALFDSYTLYLESGLSTPVTSTVVTDFTGLQITLENLLDSNTFDYDDTGNIRGNRYWHTLGIVRDRIYASYSFLLSPNNRNLAFVGVDSDGFIAVFANEDAGYTQTGRVWAITDLVDDGLPAVELVAERIAPSDGANVNGQYFPTDWDLDVDGLNPDWDTIHRWIGYGSPSATGQYSIDSINPVPNTGEYIVHSNGVAITYSSVVEHRTGVVGSVWEIWVYGSQLYFLYFTTTTGAAATNRLEWATVPIQGNFKGLIWNWLRGTTQKLIRYNLRGENGYNYLV